MWEKYRLVASHTCPSWALNAQPRCVHWLRIEPTAFWGMGWCSNQLSHPGWVDSEIFRDSTCYLLLLETALKKTGFLSLFKKIFIFNPHMRTFFFFIAFRERWRERNIYAFCPRPDQGITCTQTRNRTCNLSVMGWGSKLSHIGREGFPSLFCCYFSMRS